MSLVNNLDLFSGFTQEDKENLDSFSQERIYETGEKIFLEGDEANALYIIISGEISITQIKGNESKIIGILKSGDILGEMSFFSQENKKPRSATAEVLKTATLYVIHEYNIYTIFKKYPDLYNKLKELALFRVFENKA